jgi:hypothetical protein
VYVDVPLELVDAPALALPAEVDVDVCVFVDMGVELQLFLIRLATVFASSLGVEHLLGA